MDKDILHALCKLNRCRVIMHDLPGARGITVKEGTGYLIIIHTELSEQQQLTTIWHELLHIILGHLDTRSYLTDAQKEYEVKHLM